MYIYIYTHTPFKINKIKMNNKSIYIQEYIQEYIAIYKNPQHPN